MRTDTKHRIFELDALRGLALILMCLDHLAVDLAFLPYWFPSLDSPVIETLATFGASVAYSHWRLVLHYIFASLFLLLAGVGSALTGHPLRRFGQILGAAAVLSVATVLLDLFFDLGVTILFGVLSAMAVGVFLCFLADRLGGKYTALAVGIVFIVIGFSLQWYDAPSLYYFSWEDLPGIVMGTVRYGADWFPVFPCAGVVLVGYFLGKVLYPNRRSLIPALRGKTCLLCAVGQKSLWIYLLHQPILAGILFLLIFIFVRN